jgi:regulatory protein
LNEKNTDNLEQGRNSSSPNDNVTVSSVETGTSAGVLTITLSDGSLFFVLADIWNQSGLNEGDRCSTQEIGRIWAQSEAVRVGRKAMDMLARRDYSRYEMRLRLETRGFDPQIIGMVLDDLAARGLQDDARFAYAWISSRLRRRPEGRRNLLLALRELGVAAGTAAEALSDYDREEPDWETAALRRAYERVTRRAGLADTTIVQRLGRLGFPFSQIRDIMGGREMPE